MVLSMSHNPVSMSDLSEFNNNNYMPGFYGDMNSIAQHNLASSLNLRGNNLPQPFTFTSPTHGSSLSNLRPSGQTASQMGHVSAPGVGTTWQHSVPAAMPWGNNLSPSITQQGVVYAEEHAHPFTGYNSSMLDPQPSCSSPMKRPKRKAIEYSEDAPTSKVYLCTNQFANLQISPEKEPNDERYVRKISYSTHPKSESRDRDDITGWERFREVESSIDFDCEGESRKTAGSKKEGVICIDDDLIQEARPSSSSILPKKVLDDIARPCLQVVLWKSPGEIMRDVVKEDHIDSISPSDSAAITSPSLASPSSSQSSTITSESSRRYKWSSSSPSSSSSNLSDNMMVDEPVARDFVARPADPMTSPVTLSSSANPCLLSPSSPNLNWLHSSLSSSSSPSSSANHQLNLASSSNQGQSPFGGFFGNPGMTAASCDSDLLEDDMLL